MRLALVILLAAAPLAAAQEPEPVPSPDEVVTEREGPPGLYSGPSPAPSPGAPEDTAAAAKEEAPKEPTCTQEAPCLSAEVQQTIGKGHYRASGFVDLKLGDTRIQADTLELFEGEGANAGPRRVVAEGNVVFLRGDERLSGTRLDMDLDTGKGRFENAFGFVQPGVFIEGKLVERTGQDTYKIDDARFTSCAQPTPRWSFQASSATLKVDDRITATNVIFKVKSVPAFYIPYFAYPIQSDQRSTGILFPHIGYSSLRGFNVGEGFFWAMGRSFDQTFYADHYSRFGYGLGHELRWALANDSKGTFRSYGFLPTKLTNDPKWDYDLDWTATHTFGRDLKINVLVRQYSSILFQQQFQENLDFFSRRSRNTSATIQKRLPGNVNATLLADSVDTFFQETHRVNRHLPTLRLIRQPRKINALGGLVFGFEARGENLQFGTEEKLDKYARYDVFPRISRPITASFLSVTPELRLRYTRYGSRLEDNVIVPTPLVRRYLETTVDLRGPTFARVIDTPGNVYSERFKHVIGPEVNWTYRTRVDDFNKIVKFDGQDFALGTNQVNYALAQRFYAKRSPGEGKKPEAFEFLSWRVGQTYYVQIGDRQNEFDPNYSTAVFGPGGVPSHYSPLQSRLRIRPTNAFSTNFDTEYDVNFKQMRSLSVFANVTTSRVRFDAGWSRVLRVTDKPELRVPIAHTLRGSANLDLWPGKIQVRGSSDYDLVNKNLVQATAGIRYGVQCCAVVVEAIQSDYNVKQDRQFRFSLELANIGSIGNFMGQDEAEQRRGRGVYP